MYLPKIHYDYDIEAAVLGICLAEPTAFSQCRTVIDKSCFYGLNHGVVFEAIADRFDKGYPIDILTVSRFFFDKEQVALDNGETVGHALTSLMLGVYSSAHLDTWCMMLRELSAKRMFMEFRNTGNRNADVFDEAADIETKLRKILEIKSTDDWKHISQVAIAAVKDMEAKDGTLLPGITTSIALLDRINGGFRNSDFIIIAARPGVGKSAFMGGIATHAAFDGKRVGIISLEMDDIPLFNRMVSAKSDTDFYKIDRNMLKEEADRKRVYKSISDLSTLPISFSDTAQVSMSDIRAKIEKLRRRSGVDVILIDYLQLIEPENEKAKIREQEVAKISRGCKLLAKSMRIPIILLAQLNRQAADKATAKPELQHLRESGSLEQDADVVLFLHRPFAAGILVDENGESNEKTAELLVRKWRNGATIEIKIGFEPTQMKFYDLEQVQKSIVQNPPASNPRTGISNTAFLSGSIRNRQER